MKKISVALCLLVSAPEILNKGADAPVFNVKSETVEETFHRIAEEYDVHARKIGHAITRAESDFRNICNTEGCRYGIGPMQEICAAGSFTKWHTDIQVAFWEKCQQSNERN